MWDSRILARHHKHLYCCGEKIENRSAFIAADVSHRKYLHPKPRPACEKALSATG